MDEIDPEDRNRWVEQFEKTTEEVVRLKLSRGGYQAGDKGGQKTQAAFDWLNDLEAQRKKLATYRFRMGFWVAVASVVVVVILWVVSLII